MDWCTIESDPGVFTELIHSIGCTDVQLEEVITLDTLPSKTLGLIFLFKFKKELYANDNRHGISSQANQTVYFARQTIQNACATQAIINILLNSNKIELGDTLKNFKEFTSTLPYDMRGDMIGQQELIRAKHNSFARNDPFVSADDNDDKDKEKGDAFHFVAYTPVNGNVYELDGLRDGPILINTVTENQNWIDVAKEEIQRRIGQFDNSEINFNLMAIVENTGKLAKAELATLENNEANQSRKEELEQIIAEEEAKYEKYSKENKRRRHNYIPFIMKAMQAMAKKKILMDSFSKGLEEVKKQNEEKKKMMMKQKQQKEESTA
jgi:ubiquitin carboxyl-terminal hydrolase L5